MNATMAMACCITIRRRRGRRVCMCLVPFRLDFGDDLHVHSVSVCVCLWVCICTCTQMLRVTVNRGAAEEVNAIQWMLLAQYCIYRWLRTDEHDDDWWWPLIHVYILCALCCDSVASIAKYSSPATLCHYSDKCLFNSEHRAHVAYMIKRTRDLHREWPKTPSMANIDHFGRRRRRRYAIRNSQSALRCCWTIGGYRWVFFGRHCSRFESYTIKQPATPTPTIQHQLNNSNSNAAIIAALLSLNISWN